MSQREDRDARRQLLLTRMALNRAEMRMAMVEMRRTTGLRGALGSVGAALWRNAGKRTRRRSTGLLRVAWRLLRRPRVAAAVLGLAPAVVGHWRGLARLALVGVVAAGAWRLWRASRHGQPPQVDPAGADKT